MRRSRIVALLVAVAAVLAGSLALASPASADDGGAGRLGPIQNYGNHLCMQPQDNSPEEGALVVQEPCDLLTTGVRNLMQEWEITCISSNCGTFYFINRGSGLCLRARGLTAPANGEQIMMWSCEWISDVRWSAGNGPVAGTFILHSRLFGTTNYCLDVPGASGEVGLALQLYRCNQSVAQIWQVAR